MALHDGCPLLFLFFRQDLDGAVREMAKIAFDGFAIYLATSAITPSGKSVMQMLREEVIFLRLPLLSISSVMVLLVKPQAEG